MKDFFYDIVNLSFGDVGLVWLHDTRPYLIKVVMTDNHITMPAHIRQLFTDAKQRSNSKINFIAGQLHRYDEGEEATFPLEDLYLYGCSPFYYNVWMETYRIPIGKVSTYGHVAKNIYASGAARAVGTALSRNPFPIIIPCHRVIQANGKPGNFSSGGEATKKSLLKKEGVVFNERGKINIEYIL